MSVNPQVQPTQTELEQEELLPLPEWLVELNRELGSLAAASAEQAFGMGCTTSLVPIVILLVAAFLLGIRHWVSLLLVGFILVLLATVWAIFVAYQAHGSSLRRSWLETIRPAFEQGLLDRQVTEEEAREAARSLLAEQSPLNRGLYGKLEHSDDKHRLE